MKLIDVDKLKDQGWVLEKHGPANTYIATMSLADVPVVLETDDFIGSLTRTVNGLNFLGDNYSLYGAMMIKKIVEVFKNTIGER